MGKKSGVVYDRNDPNGNTKNGGGGVRTSDNHRTQYDRDKNDRYSRDDESDWHYTNQNEPKGSPKRH